MKKQLISLIIVLIACSHVAAQQGSDIVVVVDVSGSVNKDLMNARSTAKEIVKKLVVDGRFDQNSYSDWEFSTAGGILSNIRQGISIPLINSNQRAFIRYAGEKNTSNTPVAQIDLCNNPGGFNTFIDEYYPQQFTDNLTYIKLAKTQAARYASDNGSCSYLLIEITDSREDQLPINPYTADEQDWVDSYGVKSNIETATLGVIRYKPVSNYQIVISEVNIVGNNCAISPACGVSVAKPKLNPKIVLNALSKNSNEPNELNTQDGRLTLSWQCIDCPDAVIYRVILKKVSGSQSDILLSESNLKTNRVTINDLGSGDYEFSVSASGTLADIKSQRGYFKIKGGSGALIFLFITGLAVAGFFIYKKISTGQGEASEGRGRRKSRVSAEDDFGSDAGGEHADDFDF